MTLIFFLQTAVLTCYTVALSSERRILLNTMPRRKQEPAKSYLDQLSQEARETFAHEYAQNGGRAAEAAEAAGYARGYGATLLRRTDVQHAIHRHLLKGRCRSGAVGIDTLITIATNERQPAAARVSAARTLVEHAGLIGGPASLLEAQRAAADADEGGGSNNVVNYREFLEALSTVGKRAS